MPKYRLLSVILTIFPGGCGIGPSSITEFWDRDSKYSTASMQIEIKKSIFCELRAGVKAARYEIGIARSYQGKDVTSSDDQPFPDSWGAQIELSMSADEKTTLSPGVIFKTPLPAQTVLLRNGPEQIGQSYATGLGLNLSSQNYRQDKFDFFYSAAELIGPTKLCDPDDRTLEKPSTSSPFVFAGNLGIAEWLPGAVAVTQAKRSSRKALNGEGPALSMEGKSADSATYNNKFTVVTSGNVSPVWNLVKIATPSSSLFDLNRTRVHELLITIGQAQEPLKEPKGRVRSLTVPVSLAQPAANAHLASQIGNAVASALRGN